MNEENELNHRILAGVKEGPADCIRIDEVAAALKMKRHKAPGLSVTATATATTTITTTITTTTPWAIKKRAIFIFLITLANIDGFP